MKKIFVIIAAVFFLSGLFIRPVSADMGPKPSVTITISDPPEGRYYVTLLGNEEHGPWGFVNEENMEADVSGEEETEAYKAFLTYEDEEGYRLLNYVSECSEDHEFKWSYYPPENFKIAIYSVKDQSLKVSQAINREAFEAYYDVNFKNDMSVSEDTRLGRRIALFAIRVIVTIGVELLLGVILGYRSKSEIRTIIITNLITQVTLNLFMSLIDYSTGAYAWLIFFPIGELIVLVIEMIVYLIKFKGQNKFKTVLYSMFANGLTLYLSFISLMF